MSTTSILPSFTRKVALIAGASRGIGAATVHAFAQAGAAVALAARDAQELEAVAMTFTAPFAGSAVLHLKQAGQGQ